VVGLVRKYQHFFRELLEHSKYSFLAVFVAMVGAYFYSFDLKNFHQLFHAFHYPHITFACATAFINYMRHHRNLIAATVVSLVVPPVFCTLSDVLLPFLGGRILGVDMHLHLCFFCNQAVILLYLSLGLLIGFTAYWLSLHNVFKNLRIASLVSHFLHELVSAIASIIYIIGFGFVAWKSHLIAMTVLMICCVIFPCVVSDLVMPIFFAKILGRDDYRCFHGIEKSDEKRNS
jgi:hypothetical protein